MIHAAAPAARRPIGSEKSARSNSIARSIETGAGVASCKWKRCPSSFQNGTVITRSAACVFSSSATGTVSNSGPAEFRFIGRSTEASDFSTLELEYRPPSSERICTK